MKSRGKHISTSFFQGPKARNSLALLLWSPQYKKQTIRPKKGAASYSRKGRAQPNEERSEGAEDLK